MLLFAAQTLLFETIELKFIETDHTQKEVDSMHVTIDSHRKNLKISWPDECSILLESARTALRYIVRQMQQINIFDFTIFQVNSMPPI
jgi:hypothetical protein